MLNKGDMFRTVDDGALYLTVSDVGDYKAVSLVDGKEFDLSFGIEGEVILKDAEDQRLKKIEIPKSVWYQHIKSPQDDHRNRPFGVPFSYVVDGHELMMIVSLYRIFTITGEYMNRRLLYWPEILKDGQWYVLHAEFDDGTVVQVKPRPAPKYERTRT